MTKYTRRSFVKRAGSTALGTALGLGLLPSLTRKLEATDSSGLPGSAGIKYNWPNMRNASTTNTVPLTGGGSMKLSTEHGTLLKNTCQVTVRVNIKYTVQLVNVVAPGGPYNITKSWELSRVYACVEGSPVLTDALENVPVIQCPPNVPPANAVVEVDIAGAPPPASPQSRMAAITVNGTTGPQCGYYYPFPPPISPILECCALG